MSYFSMSFFPKSGNYICWTFVLLIWPSQPPPFPQFLNLYLKREKSKDIWDRINHSLEYGVLHCERSYKCMASIRFSSCYSISSSSTQQVNLILQTLQLSYKGHRQLEHHRHRQPAYFQGSHHQHSPTQTSKSTQWSTKRTSCRYFINRLSIFGEQAGSYI